MSEKIRFDYYYGQEAEQFRFYRIPKLLITDSKFSSLSNEAKLLYGLMLDHMSLSMENNWIDKKNRVYIIYTIKTITKKLNISAGKAGKLLGELDEFGLIEKVRRGQGKPDLIYIKSFVIREDKDPEMQNLKSRNSENGFQEIQDLNFKKLKSEMSGNTNIDSLESQNLMTNDTDIKETKKNQTDPINLFEERMKMVRKNICYDWHVKNDNSDDRKAYLQLYNIIESVMADNSDKIRIGDSLFFSTVVKSRMMKLTEIHLRYVIDCVSEQDGEIKKMDKYLLAALYRAPETIDMYYAQRVHHDYVEASNEN